ncbi:MAG: 2-amino-4-hydroxy-6-hydroxymethyldihydropteridine diphosphokinase [Planctomycetota bacterium]
MRARNVVIGLGGNLGSRRQTLQKAIEQVAQIPGFRLVSVSGLYETKAWGGPRGQRNYFNAALRGLVGSLSPKALLAELQGIERDAGRERNVLNGPRTLDLDLLLFAAMVSVDADLTLPHPRMLDRAFVMAPVAEIASDLMHPTKKRTLGELAKAVGNDGILQVVPFESWCVLGATPGT